MGEQADRAATLRRLLARAIGEWKMEHFARQYGPASCPLLARLARRALAFGNSRPTSVASGFPRNMTLRIWLTTCARWSFSGLSCVRCGDCLSGCRRASPRRRRAGSKAERWTPRGNLTRRGWLRHSRRSDISSIIRGKKALRNTSASRRLAGEKRGFDQFALAANGPSGETFVPRFGIYGMYQHGSNAYSIGRVLRAEQCILQHSGTEPLALLSTINSQAGQHDDTDRVSSKAACHAFGRFFTAEAHSECVVRVLEKRTANALCAF
jgi:hypothetical protein